MPVRQYQKQAVRRKMHNAHAAIFFELQNHIGYLFFFQPVHIPLHNRRIVIPAFFQPQHSGKLPAVLLPGFSVQKMHPLCFFINILDFFLVHCFQLLHGFAQLAFQFFFVNRL